MAKRKSTSAGKATEVVGGYKVLGRTRDGVPILKPKGKPQSFTVSKLKRAIRTARAGKAA